MFHAVKDTVISSFIPCKEGQSQFTTVSKEPLTDQGCQTEMRVIVEHIVCKLCFIFKVLEVAEYKLSHLIFFKRVVHRIF